MNTDKSGLSSQYLFAKLEPEVIRQLVRLDGAREETVAPVPAEAATPAFNLDADGIITGHSDICHDQVTDAMLTAIATT